MHDEAIGRAVKKARRASNISQVGLAGLLLVAQSAICRIEKGKQSLLASQAIELRRILGFKLENVIL